MERNGYRALNKFRTFTGRYIEILSGLIEKPVMTKEPMLAVWIWDAPHQTLEKLKSVTDSSWLRDANLYSR